MDKDTLARAAGFLKSHEITTRNDRAKVATFAGIDVIAEPTMPEGWLALRNDKGVMCMGPDGKSFWVPAFNPDDLLKKTLTLEEPK